MRPFWLAPLALAFLWTTPAVPATQIVENGVLVGATGVNVGGTLYDVSFVDGSCISVFSGCDNQSDFAFSTAGVAQSAAQALLDQVLIDGPQGNFASPGIGLTRGCEGAICDAFVPYAFYGTEVYFAGAKNQSGDAIDTTFTYGHGLRTDSLSDYSRLTWANFSAPAVPEPETWAMMLMGFAAIGVFMRRRRKGLPTTQHA